MTDFPIALAVHGGAGTIERGKLSAASEQEHRAGIENALRAGQEVLASGGSSLDAVEAAVRSLEDNPLFNAGRGAVFNATGINELDAAIMDGRTQAAGAVAAVQHVRNPVTLARAVMEKSKHVLLIGGGAEEFAKSYGIELVDAKYFFTPERWDSLRRLQEKEKLAATSGKGLVLSDWERHGTVGAVARDRRGNLAAATSTGGMTNKLPGRVGDCPVIGAGTFADNASCAVSCTGDGEHFIRAAVAHEVSALMRLRGMSLSDAASGALRQAKKLGGEGGLIAVGRTGEPVLPFNTNGMYRGRLALEGTLIVDIYS